MTKPNPAKYRHRLPQLEDGALSYRWRSFDLPMFETFVLLESERGRAALRSYFDRYIAMAVKRGTGFILNSPT